MLINKFGVGTQNKHIKSSEFSISRQMETILRAKHFLQGTREAFDAKNKRITHMDSPREDSDSVNKSYLDSQLLHLSASIKRNAPENLISFMSVMLRLNANRVLGGFLIIEPYENIFYEFSSAIKIAFLFRDFSPNQIEIQVDGIQVGEPHLSSRTSFMTISASSKIAFKKVGEIKKLHLHCELLVGLKIDTKDSLV